MSHLQLPREHVPSANPNISPPQNYFRGQVFNKLTTPQEFIDIILRTRHYPLTVIDRTYVALTAVNGNNLIFPLETLVTSNDISCTTAHKIIDGLRQGFVDISHSSHARGLRLALSLERSRSDASGNRLPSWDGLNLLRFLEVSSTRLNVPPELVAHFRPRDIIDSNSTDILLDYKSVVKALAGLDFGSHDLLHSLELPDHQSRWAVSALIFSHFGIHFRVDLDGFLHFTLKQGLCVRDVIEICEKIATTVFKTKLFHFGDEESSAFLREISQIKIPGNLEQSVGIFGQDEINFLKLRYLGSSTEHSFTLTRAEIALCGQLFLTLLSEQTSNTLFYALSLRPDLILISAESALFELRSFKSLSIKSLVENAWDHGLPPIRTGISPT